MTTATHSYNQFGPFDADDVLTQKFLIKHENERRTAFNATVPPPATPLPLLLFSTAAERRASVEAIINATVPKWWLSYVAQAKEAEQRDPKFSEVKDAWANATTAQRNAGLAALKA